MLVCILNLTLFLSIKAKLMQSITISSITSNKLYIKQKSRRQFFIHGGILHFSLWNVSTVCGIIPQNY